MAIPSEFHVAIKVGESIRQEVKSELHYAVNIEVRHPLFADLKCQMDDAATSGDAVTYNRLAVEYLHLADEQVIEAIRRTNESTNRIVGRLGICAGLAICCSGVLFYVSPIFSAIFSTSVVACALQARILAKRIKASEAFLGHLETTFKQRLQQNCAKAGITGTKEDCTW